MQGYLKGYEVEDTGVCTLKFKNGALVIIDSTFQSPICNNWYSMEIYGSKMTFMADMDNVTLIHEDETKEVIPLSQIEEGYPLPLKQWVNACTGVGKNICDIDAAVLNMKVLDAAETAKKENRTVRI